MSAPSKLVRPPGRWSHHQPSSGDGVEQVKFQVDHTNTVMISSNNGKLERVRYDDFPLGVKSFAKELCTFCEELLRHSLEHEGILSFTCGHFAHEECLLEFLAEFINDHSCPACSLPLEVESSHRSHLGKDSLVNSIRHRPRAAKQEQPSYSSPQQSSRNGNTSPRSPHTPTPQRRHHDSEILNTLSQPAFEHVVPDGYLEQLDSQSHINGHAKEDDSDITSTAPATFRHAPNLRNPIPAPTIHIKSEYPNLTRSEEALVLICVVTVEVPSGRWKPRKDELGLLRNIPETRSMQSNQSESYAELSEEDREDNTEDLQREADDLKDKVDNWHGLPFAKFGKLLVFNTLSVSKDGQHWQLLDCYLFSNMLICVKEKQMPDGSGSGNFSLKGSVMIQNHLDHVDHTPEKHTLALSLRVKDLPTFYLQYKDQGQIAEWEHHFESLLSPHSTPQPRIPDKASKHLKVQQKAREEEPISSHIPGSLHVPLDLVIVVPVSTSTHEIKLAQIRDTLRFVVHSLGPHDRLGIVNYGGESGTTRMTSLASKLWPKWGATIDSIKAIRSKGSSNNGMIEGANTALDILMERRAVHPITSVIVISDSAAAEVGTLDFAVSRAEAAKVSFYCLGYGATHRPDAMIELSARTRGSYVYVKEWTALRDCVAGCLGSLMSLSHQNARLKLRLPEGVKARFEKVHGALKVIKRAGGRDAEVELGDLRFGDRRDVLVQLSIETECASSEDSLGSYDELESALRDLRQPSESSEGSSSSGVEELPILQADLVYGDLLRGGVHAQVAHASLLAITLLPKTSNPAVLPRHPAVTRRRMELLTSEQLTIALRLIGKGRYDEAHRHLTQTRDIIRRFDSGGFNSPPAPKSTAPPKPPPSGRLPQPPTTDKPRSTSPAGTQPVHGTIISRTHSPNPATSAPLSPVMAALECALSAALEEIIHPNVFLQDQRKAVLQAIGVISSQRAFTYRTEIEGWWAQRIAGTKKLLEASSAWRELQEEAGR